MNNENLVSEFSEKLSSFNNIKVQMRITFLVLIAGAQIPDIGEDAWGEDAWGFNGKFLRVISDLHKCIYTTCKIIHYV